MALFNISSSSKSSSTASVSSSVPENQNGNMIVFFFFLNFTPASGQVVSFSWDISFLSRIPSEIKMALYLHFLAPGKNIAVPLFSKLFLDTIMALFFELFFCFFDFVRYLFHIQTCFKARLFFVPFQGESNGLPQHFLLILNMKRGRS